MAKSESRGRGTRSLAQSPQLDEGLWTKIGQHLTIKEWAKAAGACPAAWGAQCMWSMDIMADLPVAGIYHYHDYSNRALQCTLEVAKTCQGIARGSRKHLLSCQPLVAVHCMGPSPRI